MDDLMFRRTLYADPDCTDADILKAAAQDPQKQLFWDELKRLNNDLLGASKVPVPDGLLDKLMLPAASVTSNTNKNKALTSWAMAASVAMVAGFSLMLWQQDKLDLTAQAIAHVHHDGEYALGSTQLVSLEQVNSQLATLGGKLLANVGQIYFASFCDFEEVNSLHLVMQGEKGRVSVFIVPHNETYSGQGSAQDEIYTSYGADFSRASIIVVGAEESDITKMQTQLRQNIQFSA